jgi:surface antigen
MKPGTIVILALWAPSLAACASSGLDSHARPVAAAPAPPSSLPPLAPVVPVQAQPLPPASTVAATPAQPGAPAAPPPQSPAQTSLAVPAQSAPPLSPVVPAGPTLGVPIGASLSDADRATAWKAEVAALESGQRRSWRGANGVFGFVEPGGEAVGGCRTFSMTVYVAGRANRGQGVACKQADGTWKAAS